MTEFDVEKSLVQTLSYGWGGAGEVKIIFQLANQCGNNIAKVQMLSLELWRILDKRSHQKDIEGYTEKIFIS